jgi:tetratricopeptide (TPR) repeat protein
MKLFTSTAFALAAAAFATPAVAQYQGTPDQMREKAGTEQSTKVPPAAQQAGPSVKASSKASKAILDLQTTVNNKDWASVPAKVAAAQAVASTKEDRYLIARLQLSAAIGANDASAMTAAVDAIAASGEVDTAKVAELYSGLGGTFLNSKQYPQAVAAYQKAIALNPADADSSYLLAEALFQSGQKPAAATALQKYIQTKTAAGQKASEDVYRLAVQAAFDARSPAANELAREWLTAYPSADSWRNSVTIYRALNNPDTESTLDLMRLLQAANALQQASDYAVFIQDAAEQNNYNEAQAVLDAGIAAKKVDPSSGDFKELASVVRSKPNISAAELDAATKTASTGMALLHIGDRYYAAGNYAKAVELYRMAQAKPDVDANVAKLHIGMALARQGDKAGATAALNGVTGARADVAKFWLAYVNQRA